MVIFWWGSKQLVHLSLQASMLFCSVFHIFVQCVFYSFQTALHKTKHKAPQTASSVKSNTGLSETLDNTLISTRQQKASHVSFCEVTIGSLGAVELTGSPALKDISPVSVSEMFVFTWDMNIHFFAYLLFRPQLGCNSLRCFIFELPMGYPAGIFLWMAIFIL